MVAVGGHSRQLGDCLRRVLFPSAGESHCTLPIQRRPIENHSRGHYPRRVLRIFGSLSEGRVEMELSGWFCHDGERRLRHLQRMVSHGSEQERVSGSDRIGI
jgi:hypothetical protein